MAEEREGGAVAKAVGGEEEGARRALGDDVGVGSLLMTGRRSDDDTGETRNLLGVEVVSRTPSQSRLLLVVACGSQMMMS